jgi:heme/copper-type cytochrome/quinol oxidase subunit 1
MGAVFSVFTGFYYWVPKISGLCYKDFTGKVHFFTFFCGAQTQSYLNYKDKYGGNII